MVSSLFDMPKDNHSLMQLYLDGNKKLCILIINQKSLILIVKKYMAILVI